MAEYVTVVRELQRMCDKNRCAKCPITKFRHESIDCRSWQNNHPEEVERIVMQWAKENPLMTNRMKFKEVFGFEFTDRVAESQYHREWLDAEYKGGQDEQN